MASRLDKHIQEHIPVLRRYARVIVLNKIVADQFVKDCLEEFGASAHRRNLKELKLRLFGMLALKLSRKNFDKSGERDLAADALKELLVKSNRQDVSAQNLVVGLSRLSQQEREVLVLAGLEGFRYHEIAGMLNTSLANVMGRLHSARELMRNSLFGAQMVAG